MAISSTERSLDGIPDLVRGGLPGSKTDERDLVPSVKGSSFPKNYHIWSVSYW